MHFASSLLLICNQKHYNRFISLLSSSFVTHTINIWISDPACHTIVYILSIFITSDRKSFHAEKTVVSLSGKVKLMRNRFKFYSSVGQSKKSSIIGTDFLVKVGTIQKSFNTT